MDLENLFVSDLLDTLVGATDDTSTTRAVGEEGDESEPPRETTTEPEPTATTLALGEEGEQPEDHWEDGPEPEVTSQAIGEEGDQPEVSEGPADQGIWAGEDGNGGGCVIDVDDTTAPEEGEPVDEDEADEEPADEEDEDEVDEDEVDEDEAPTEANDPLVCW